MTITTSTFSQWSWITILMISLLTNTVNSLPVGNLQNRDVSTPTTSTRLAVQFNTTCNATTQVYACGPINATTTLDTIAVCQDGYWTKLDDCKSPSGVCAYISGNPYCVAASDVVAGLASSIVAGYSAAAMTTPAATTSTSAPNVYGVGAATSTSSSAASSRTFALKQLKG
ncbi:hypothetical protein HDU76_002300 [Blyttiomyces sp. JEL0837]|nr:hypothetical protein HDU76_002300 [Blyttiomyces sp. JEL0837]